MKNKILFDEFIAEIKKLLEDETKDFDYFCQLMLHLDVALFTNYSNEAHEIFKKGCQYLDINKRHAFDAYDLEEDERIVKYKTLL